MKNHVILLHGTWSRGWLRTSSKSIAPWCQENQPIRAAITSVFGVSNTQFHVFPWSGANAPAARIQAAARLADYVSAVRRQHPDDKIHVVAHSHGGNIAFYAARDADAAASLSSVICLSTPFLHISPRTLGASLGRKLVLTAGFAATAILVSLVYALWPRATTAVLRFAMTRTWQSYLVAILPAGLLIGGVADAFTRIFRAIHAANHRYAQTLQLPHTLPCPVLLLRAPGDEATAVLGATQLLSDILTRTLRWVIKLVPLDVRTAPKSGGLRTRWQAVPVFFRAGVMIWGLGIAILIALLLLRSVHIPLQRILVTSAATSALSAFVIGGATMVLPVALQFAVIPLVIALSLLLGGLAGAAFGLRFGIASVGLHISAEASPPGEWVVTQLEHPAETLENSPALNHSTHSNPAALQAVTDFYCRWFPQPPEQL